MALISNPKIGYCAYPGLSLLFDAPDDSHYKPHAGNLQKLHCRTDAIPFYAAVAEAMRRTGDGVWEQHGLLPLDPASWHVTVWDGFNAGNVEQTIPEFRARARNLLQGMPFSIRSGLELVRDVADNDLAHWQGTMRFAADRMVIIADYVLVVLLKPADQEAERTLASIEHLRDALYDQYSAHYLITGMPFMPHLSLGYFLRHEDGRMAKNFVSNWNAALQESLQEGGSSPTLDLKSVSLYGFTDMQRFYRVAAE